MQSGIAPSRSRGEWPGQASGAYLESKVGKAGSRPVAASFSMKRPREARNLERQRNPCARRAAVTPKAPTDGKGSLIRGPPGRCRRGTSSGRPAGRIRVTTSTAPAVARLVEVDGGLYASRGRPSRRSSRGVMTLYRGFRAIVIHLPRRERLGSARRRDRARPAATPRRAGARRVPGHGPWHVGRARAYRRRELPGPGRRCAPRSRR